MSGEPCVLDHECGCIPPPVVQRQTFDEITEVIALKARIEQLETINARLNNEVRHWQKKLHEYRTPSWAEVQRQVANTVASLDHEMRRKARTYDRIIEVIDDDET